MSDICSLCAPLRSAEIVRAESLTFVRDEGGRAFAPLLFNPRRIICLTDARGGRVYREGFDYTVCGDGIELTQESRIPCFTHGELYPEEGEPGFFFPGRDGNVLFHEGHFFHDRQCAVTYIPRGGAPDMEIPVCGSALSRTRARLTRGEPLALTVFGDSISVGANASGFTGAPPYQPSYAGLFARALSDRFGSAVTLRNPSKGGADSAWGRDNAALAADTCPDLAVIAFGGNDANTAPEDFARNIRAIADAVRASSPDCELILCATSLPNPLLCTDAARFFGNHPLFGEALRSLAGTINAAFADFGAMQRAVMSRKRFIDLTGNNVNHPNDFFHRLHAGCLLELVDAVCRRGQERLIVKNE